jgi:hypothetical protein
MLLEPAEEQLDMPALLVELSDGQSRQPKWLVNNTSPRECWAS